MTYIFSAIVLAIVDSTLHLFSSASESSVVLRSEDVSGVAASIAHAANHSVEELLQRGAFTTIMKQTFFLLFPTNFSSFVKYYPC